ncbi:MAG: FAD:protein FMN transferase [Gammaproteobacteria bacterium]|nr:FAD:protein FMN transferase [Gammaproteobacteria bacterium]
MYKKSAIAVLLLCVVWVLGGCGTPASEQVYEDRFYVFGTLADITLYGVDEARGREAVAAVSQDFQTWHHEWHAWEPGPLGDVNAAIAAGQPAPLIPSLEPLVQRSREAYERSEGLFNPAIGRLLQLWGFQSSERPSGPPPSREAVAERLARAPGMGDVQVRDGVLISRNPDVQLDFGGIAKGYAVELALARLRTMGIENAIVNAGGGLSVIGSRGERPWRVGIRHPQGNGVLASLEVHSGESVHTSGNYERFREHQGVRYTHILDPRTGWPVEGITSATVIGTDGTLADVAATVLVIAGPQDWHRLAQRLGIRYAMLVDEAGTVYMNQAMAERVQFSGEPPENIVISPPL